LPPCHLDATSDAASRNARFVTDSTEWIRSHFALCRGKTVLDLGCGPGLYTTAYAESGATVVGVDMSGRSLDYARAGSERLGLGIEYVQANYLDLDIPQQFDFISMIYFDFCALSPSQRSNLLGQVGRVLKPDGVMFFDVLSLEPFTGLLEGNRFVSHPDGGFWSPEPHFELHSSYVYADESVGLGKHTIVEDQGVRVIYNWLQYFSPESLSAELEEGGFCICEQFGNVAGDEADPRNEGFAVTIRRM
jgi:SAM-dependent methyltransferase